VTPQPYQGFLVASTQAAAALIGLLFVSISLAPERVFGTDAEATRQAQALSAFTALANVFFVSFGSLVPDLPLGVLVVVAGLIAEAQTLALLFALGDWRREGALSRGITLFLGSAVLYAFEIRAGVRLLQVRADPGALTGLLELLLFGYAIGLARAWELLGAPHNRSVFTRSLELLSRRLRRGGTKPDAPG